ncbi:MAG TPA: GNAT family N-acetyltransferase [Pyrinomonadaceae bacterium]|nr:GNAT family N-acetyltransferase [Pyrinomonadaceae bacterium]
MPKTHAGRVLETARTRLRQFMPADLEALARIVADAEVMKYLGRVPGPLTLAETETFLHSMIAHWERHGFGRCAVEWRKDSRLIGCAGLRSHEGTAELVYLLDRPFWGMGLATEIAEACLRYGFEVHGFTRIVAFARPANAASRRVLEKLGMCDEGEVDAYGINVVQYAITRQEFNTRRGSTP